MRRAGPAKFIEPATFMPTSSGPKAASIKLAACPTTGSTACTGWWAPLRSPEPRHGGRPVVRSIIMALLDEATGEEIKGPHPSTP